jgi:hypothetical protein
LKHTGGMGRPRHPQEGTLWSTNVVTSCPVDSIASRPPCAAALSVTSTPVPSAPLARAKPASQCPTGSTAKALRTSSTEPCRPWQLVTSVPAEPLSSFTESRCLPARRHRSQSWSPGHDGETGF